MTNSIKVKFFTEVQKNFTIIGLKAQHSAQKYPFTTKNILAISMLCMGSILTTIFFLWEAETFQEQTDSGYITSTYVASVFIFTSIVWYMKELFDFIENFENAIQNSKSESNIFK